MEKLDKGEKPNRDEARALKKWEQQQFEEHGQRYLAGMPKGHVTEILGSPASTLIKQHEASGLPYPKEKTALVDGRELLRFLWKRFIGGETAESEEAARLSRELALELAREKLREKQIANRKREMEMRLLEEAHIPTAMVETFAMGMAEVTRKKGENAQRTFEKEYGLEAAEAVHALLEDIASAWERRALNEFGDGSDSEKHDPAA